MEIHCSTVNHRRFRHRLVRNYSDGGGEDVHFAIVLTNRTTLQATREAGLVQIAITGQSLPILRRVKYCALRGRSGYIFTSPILRDRTRMPVSFAASATHDGFQVAEARHEANSCPYAAL